jgi:quercetin dioxygenase-like cupin family protein
MTLVNLMDTAARLPEVWRSRVLGQVGPARVKVMRMNQLPVREETHRSCEALLVLDGLLELQVGGLPVSVAKGELYMVPAGTPHAARRGSHGTLVIVELHDELAPA